MSYLTGLHRFRMAPLLVLGLLGLAAARQSAAVSGTFTCGRDQSLPPIQLLWTAIVLAGDGRLYSPCEDGAHTTDHREIREATVIGQGRYLPDELRWRAAQAQARNSTKPHRFPVLGGPDAFESVVAQLDGLGGLIIGSSVQPACTGEVQIIDGTTNPRRWQPGRLFFMLRETAERTVLRSGGGLPPQGDPGLLYGRIAKEGAYAIGLLIRRTGLDPNVVRAAAKELRACFLSAGDSELAGLILEDLGLAGYETEGEVQAAENFLVEGSHGTAPRILGAVKGLEALLRLYPLHHIGEPARLRLRQLVTYGDRSLPPPLFDTGARIRRLALMALMAAHDLDAAILTLAASDADWQVRRLVAGSLNPSDPQMAALGAILAVDAAFQVRYESLSLRSRRATETSDCRPMIERFKDPSPIVVMRAIDLLPSACTNLDEVSKALIPLADQVTSPLGDMEWHIGARALSALGRLRPVEAKARLAATALSAVWQVRATAAAVSGMLGDEESAMKFARDPEPNVQTAGLDALRRMRSLAVVPLAIAALKHGSDYQLIWMAATVLRGLPDYSKDEASTALLIALRKLTDEESDTSRYVRIAIVDRLGETLEPSHRDDLLPFATDIDDEVNASVIKLHTKLGNAPSVAPSPKRRYPYQPTPDSLATLPSQALIQLSDGLVILNLLKDVAPVTIARFTELVRRGYYNGLTFHRVVPNFIVQGGSPGANDFMGTTRYLREEVGPQATHIRGAVGMSTRGNDTGDGQIFIDLVDLPRFDREYTVFAYVTQGLELIDKLLEGAKIVNISVK